MHAYICISTYVNIDVLLHMYFVALFMIYIHTYAWHACDCLHLLKYFYVHPPPFGNRKMTLLLTSVASVKMFDISLAANVHGKVFSYIRRQCVYENK